MNQTQTQEKIQYWTQKNIPITQIAESIQNTINTNIFHTQIIHDICHFDTIGQVEVYLTPLENQVYNRIKRRTQKGTLTTETYADDLIESYIYQYKKEYKNKKTFNKQLRQFKKDLINITQTLPTTP